MVLLNKGIKMITYKIGNILTEDAEAIVNTVNCVGVMGRGIALQFKNHFPENFKSYAAACNLKEVQPGKMFIFETNTLTDPKYIVNFPTKRHWRGKSRMEDIQSGLFDLVQEIKKRGIKSIAIPPLGSGLGGLDWQDVKALIEDAIKELDGVHIIIYEPKEAPSKTRSLDVPKMTAGRASLVSLIKRYLDGFMDPSITLLEIHKLMYFMQVAGEPLKLKYKKHHYGPYAENLRHVLNKIEGHLTVGYADGGDAPTKEISLVPGAVKDASAFLENETGTNARLNEVASLVDGFETPFGLELLSTVHWVVKEQGANSIGDVIAATHSWNNKKKQFSERQIKIAYEVLKEKKWLN